MFLQKLLERHVERQPFNMGIGVLDVDSGEHCAVRGDEVFPMASTFKVPLLYALMQAIERGELSLDEELRPPPRPSLGSGLLSHLRSASHLTVHDLAYLMITISDNLAADMLLARIGGPDSLNHSLSRLGLNRIHVAMDCFQTLSMGRGWDPQDEESIAAILEKPEKLKDYPVRTDSLIFQQSLDNNVATPSQMTKLLAEIINPTQVSIESSKFMMSILENQQFVQRMPSLLPEGVRVLNKTGTITGGVCCDVGVILLEHKRIAFSAYIVGAPKNYGRYTDKAIAEAARVVYDYYA